MGVTFQLFAVTDEQIAEFRSDPDVARVLAHDHYGTSEPGFSLWLDKAGVGILEAVGVMSGSAVAPAAWVLGDQAIDVSGIHWPCLTASQVVEVARWASGVSDQDFEGWAESNEIDPDVEYLTHLFGQLREFYLDAAESRSAVLASVSV